MSRLASFKGPSTPSPSPVRVSERSSSSPSRSLEPIYYRKARNLLNEFRAAASNCDDLLSDGQETLEKLINTRTELENEMTLVKMTVPPAGFITPRIQKMEKCLHDLSKISNSSQKVFEKMSLIVDSMEQLLFDACQSKGSRWTQYEPLLLTWSLDHLVQRLASLIHVYHRTNLTAQRLVSEIRPHDTPFSRSSQLLAQWIAQLHLTRLEWEEWDEVIKVELAQ